MRSRTMRPAMSNSSRLVIPRPASCPPPPADPRRDGPTCEPSRPARADGEAMTPRSPQRANLRGRPGKKPLVRGDSRNVYGSAGTCRGFVQLRYGKQGDKGKDFFDHLDFGGILAAPATTVFPSRAVSQFGSSCRTNRLSRCARSHNSCASKFGRGIGGELSRAGRAEGCTETDCRDRQDPTNKHLNSETLESSRTANGKHLKLVWGAPLTRISHQR